MGFRDLFIMFKTNTTKKFKVSVIVSIVLFIFMIGVLFHAYISVRQNYIYELNTHITLMYFSFIVGIITFMVINFSKHKFLKGLGLIILKSIIMVVAFVFLYALGFQTLVFPVLYINDTLFVLSAVISVTFIKLILG